VNLPDVYIQGTLGWVPFYLYFYQYLKTYICKERYLNRVKSQLRFDFYVNRHLCKQTLVNDPPFVSLLKLFTHSVLLIRLFKNANNIVIHLHQSKRNVFILQINLKFV